MTYIDTHLHLWDLSGGGYGWITPSMGPLYRSFDATEAAAFHRDAGYSSAILVQADDTRADTRALLRVAARCAWVHGVVGWVPLEDPAAVAEQLQEYERAGAPIVGIRQLVHDDPRPDVLELPQVRESLQLLAQHDLVFEVPDAFPRHLDQATRLAQDLPELTVVIDHLGKPPVPAGQFAEWRAQFRAAAGVANVAAKVSGLHHGGRALPPQVLQAAWDVAAESFGPQRLCLGSDWPIPLLGDGMAATVSGRDRIMATLTAREREDVGSEVARRIYGLEPSC